jgi:hypothetical protein
MVPDGLLPLSVLVIAGFVMVIGQRPGGQTATGLQRMHGASGSAVGQASKQHANSYVVAPSVYCVPAPAPYWPGVCAGRSAAEQAAPVYGGDAGHRLLQRRRPSRISARINAHGVLR